MTRSPAGRALVITSPAPLPVEGERICIFLAGSIDAGNAPDWQGEIIAALSDCDAVILNPRRISWDVQCRPDADDPDFRQQVEWELEGLERADTIAMYLTPASLAPISLLELGLFARSGKLILCCPDGFWRKGNVGIVAERWEIEQVADLEALTRALRWKCHRTQE